MPNMDFARARQNCLLVNHQVDAFVHASMPPRLLLLLPPPPMLLPVTLGIDQRLLRQVCGLRRACNALNGSTATALA